MKRLIFMSFLVMSTFISSEAIAQKESKTTKTATTKLGYTVMNPGEMITIYKYVHASHSPKEADKYAPKYYFTSTSTDVLQELTKENLKKTFSDRHSFHDALDANFKQDKALVSYDSFHKMYKVNWLYQSTNK